MTRTVAAGVKNALKGNLPFRLGTTSYILPDEILPNVRWLAPQVDDIELLLFESNTDSNLPSPEIVAELAAIARAWDLTFTIHLPLDLAFGHPDPSWRRQAVESSLRLADRMEPLLPAGYVVHCNGDRRGSSPSAEMERWLSGHRQALRALSGRLGSRRLCVETLEYPFDLVLSVVEELDLAVCLDIGHLLLNGRDALGHFERLADRLRIVHAHGICDGQDHRSLAACDPAVLSPLLGRLQRLAGAAKPGITPVILTIEVFSEEDFQDSMQVMGRLIASGAMAGAFESRPPVPIGGEAAKCR